MNAPFQSGAPLAHTVSDAPFDPRSVSKLSPAQERIYLASQWQLMRWKFARHRMAVISVALLAVLYATIPFTEFLAPYAGATRHTDFIHAPPQAIHLFADGGLSRPYVYGSSYQLNMQMLKRDYAVDRNRIEPIRFLCHGDPYRFWGLVPSDLHLFCPAPGGTLFLLGSDRLGRDVMSRILYGARVSRTVGLLGISFSFCLGLIIGGLAG